MSVRGQPSLAIGVWFLSAGLLVGAFAWPPWRLQHSKAETERIAGEAPRRVAVEERVSIAEHRRYASFDSQSGNVRVSLPKLDLEKAANAFDLDAMPEDNGHQHPLGVPKAEAILGLRISPNLSTLDLPKDPPDKS